MKFVIATPVYGDLEVHADGCGHLKKLWYGGGILWDEPTLEKAIRWAQDEVNGRARLMPCASGLPSAQLYVA